MQCLHDGVLIRMTLIHEMRERYSLPIIVIYNAKGNLFAVRIEMRWHSSSYTGVVGYRPIVCKQDGCGNSIPHAAPVIVLSPGRVT
jgi:hypothetical protein